MDGVKRVSGKVATVHHASSVDHRRVQRSTTLNRKFVKKPVARARINVAAGEASKSLKIQKVAQQQRQQIQQQQQRAQQAQQVQQAQAIQQQGRSQQVQQGQQVNRSQIRARQQVMVSRQQGQRQQRRGLLNKAGVRLQPVAKKVTREQQQGQQQQAQQVQRAQRQVQKVAGRQIAVAKQQQDRGVQRNHVVQVAKARQAARKSEPVHLSAQELKDRAIKQALRKVGQVEGDEATQFSEAKQEKQHFWQKRRFAIASAMAVVSIALLGYLVYLNMPDISVRVAAMQTGIEKAYPSYVPADYRLDGLVKEDAGRITMNFKNNEGKKFTLMEEKSSWDSSAVLSNYVKKNWGSEYSIAKGQGLTIYVSKSNAAWVNGGVFYVITDEEGNLSSTDLHDIAVSL